MTNEKILLNYGFKKTYTTVESKGIGATKSLTLRTVTTGTALTNKYVRKFGDPWMIKSVSEITDPVDADLTYGVYALDGTLLGSRVGGGSFVAGATLSTAQASYIKITATGSGTVLTAIAVTSDVEALTFVTPAEVLTSGMTINLYLSSTTSTYYDSILMHGGARHTPTGAIRLPYFNITDGLGALTGAFVICEVLDSAEYFESVTLSGAFTLQASLGQTPTIVQCAGQHSSHPMITALANNLVSIYFNENGNNTTGTGTWQNPFATMTHSVTNAGTKRSIVYGGTGALSGKITETTTADMTIASGGTWVIDADHGLTPLIEVSYNGYLFTSPTSADYGILQICGFKIDFLSFNSSLYYCTRTSATQLDNYNIKHCEMKNTPNADCVYVNGCAIANISYNIFSNVRSAFDTFYAGATNQSNVVASYNIFKDSTYGLWLNTNYIDLQSYFNQFIRCGTGIYKGSTNSRFTRTAIENNLFYSCTGSGADLPATCSQQSFKNNIFVKNTVGITYGGAGLTLSYCNFYLNTTKYTAGTFTSTNESTANPLFIDETNEIFALSSLSTLKKADGSENDIGVRWKTILISSSTVIINGFILDGNGSGIEGIGTTGATDYTAMTIKFCTFTGFVGMAVELYSGADTSATVSNCKFYRNGCGLSLKKGLNDVSYCSFSNHYGNGIYSAGSPNFFNHVTSVLNKYGFYFATTLQYVRNSISAYNLTYGIYSTSAITVYYSCILDATYNVTSTPSSIYENITEMPGFFDYENDDLKLKSIAHGDGFDSPCIGVASDGTDMGSEQSTATLSAYSFKKYTLEYNPRAIDFEILWKGISSFTDGQGGKSLFGVGQKRIFSMAYKSGQYVTNELRKRIEYFNSLVMTRDNGLTADQTVFRLHLLPTQFLSSGSGVVNATGKYVTFALGDLIDNEFKGFHIGLKLYASTGGVVDAVAKTLTKSGAGWTVNQWAGHYLYYLGYYFYIVSNTATVLTLLDPDSALVSATISFAIEKYFKINSNTKNVFYLDDDDAELVSGTYDFYVDFIEVIIGKPEIKYTQPRFYYQQETWKAGFSIVFEEK